MDATLAKLAEIEQAASVIVDSTDETKANLDHEFRKKRTEFDDELENRTNSEIQKIRADLKTRTDAIMSGLTGKDDESLAALQKEYDEHHTQYAQDILKHITEV